MAKAASRCCELANPAQMRQIASQTGDLLRQMRFVAGRGAAAESHREDVAGRGRCGGEPSGRYCWPGALRRRAIGKILPAGGAAAESHREDVAGRSAAGGMERSGSLNGRACRSAEDAAMQQMHRSRCDATDAQKPLRCNRCAEAAAMQQMRRSRCNAADVQKTLRCSRCTEAAPLGARKKRRASTDRWHRKSNPAQRLVTPMPAAQEK